jgi:hypothetical protein
MFCKKTFGKKKDGGSEFFGARLSHKLLVIALYGH